MNFFQIVAQLNLINRGKQSTDAETSKRVAELIFKLQREVPMEILPYVTALIEKNYNANFIVPEEAKVYNPYFDCIVYQQLLCYTKIAYFFEPNGNPEEQALKLAVLFGDVTSALKYVEDMKTSLHDACLFQLPPVSNCKFSIWQKKAKKYLTDSDFKKLLPLADAIEQLIYSKKNIKVNFIDIDAKKKEITAIHHQWKKLKRKHGTLTEEEKKEFQQLNITLSTLQDALVELCWNISLDNADILVLKAFHNYYIKNSDPAYLYFLQHGLTKKDYDKFMLLERANAGENIPDIIIDGKACGYPDYYLKKICVQNNEEAVRAACLGKLTDCCQSLSGEAGEPCTIHGLTDPNGGFYILCKGDINNPCISDELIAQCWVWRSKSGAIVFDSIEMPKHKIESDKFIVVDFFQYLGYELVANQHTHKVNCGAFSGISPEVGSELLFYAKEDFIDYQGHCDSTSQIAIFNPIFPYPWYETNDEITKLIHEKLERAISLKIPLAKSHELTSALNWALLALVTKDINLNADILINKIKEIAIKYNKNAEMQRLIEAMNNFIQGIDFDFNKLMMQVKNNVLPIDTLDDRFKTLLMRSIDLGEISYAEQLMKLGATIDLVNQYGHTALIELFNSNTISAESKMQLCEKILNHGADIHLNVCNKSVLMYATNANLNDLMVMLIEKGADIHYKTLRGETILSIAASFGSLELVKILIEKGVDINVQDNDGHTPLLKAINYRHNDIAEFLINEHANVNIKNNRGETPLMISIFLKNNLTSKLLEAGAEVNTFNQQNHTALGFAIFRRDEPLTLKLISLGANPNVKFDGHPLLVVAIMLNLESVVDKLIPIIEDVNAQVSHAYLKQFPNNTNNALLAAISVNNKKYVQTLIKKGADINAVGFLGKTALMSALEVGNTDMALQLIELGANLHIKDRGGVNALTYAERSNQISVTAKIKEILSRSEEAPVKQNSRFIKL